MAFQDIDKKEEHLGTEVVPQFLLCKGLASREGGRGILDLRLVYVVGHSHLGAVLQYHGDGAVGVAQKPGDFGGLLELAHLV